MREILRFAPLDYADGSLGSGRHGEGQEDEVLGIGRRPLELQEPTLSRWIATPRLRGRDVDGDGDDDLVVTPGGGYEYDPQITVYLAEDGGYGQPQEWGRMPECGTARSTSAM